MYNDKERINILAWCFCWLFVSKSLCLVEASMGAGERRFSSFFGIGDSRGDHGSFPRSLPYVRLGRLSFSKGDNNSKRTLDEASMKHWKTPPSSPVAFRRRRSLGLRTKHDDDDDDVDVEHYEADGDVKVCMEASLSTMSHQVQETDLVAMTSPIVPLSVNMDVQTGEEFADPRALDLLVSSGLEMATTHNDENDWIEWKMHSSTKKLLEENHNNEMAILEQGEVMVYIGKAKRKGHGSHLPIIKTKSILPLSAEEMADLLLDSSRVKIYNKLSVGRTDVRTLGEGTKVVCNLTKPPIAKSNMVSCTLMHSRRLESGPESSNASSSSSSPSSSYLVVSRAVPGMMDDNLLALPRNDILLGVNLLEDRGPNECIMTAVTHVYSPALPTVLAKKMGVSSATNFVRDIRNSCNGVGR
mmetsp:Transcript_28395/g.59484  ORF Transcript_28395/g.59484 Transcript_28395/m.59484 type:complete len:414 (+) Transcript_28395:72-1313(+)